MQLGWITEKIKSFWKLEETDIPPQDMHDFQRITKNLYLGSENYFIINAINLSYFNKLIACNGNNLYKKKNILYYDIYYRNDKSILEASKKLDELLNENKRVLIYCDHGNSRSRWVVVNYLSTYYKKRIDEDFNLGIIESNKYNDLKKIYSANYTNEDLFNKILEKTLQWRKNSNEIHIE